MGVLVRGWCMETGLLRRVTGSLCKVLEEHMGAFEKIFLLREIGNGCLGKLGVLVGLLEEMMFCCGCLGGNVSGNVKVFVCIMAEMMRKGGCRIRGWDGAGSGNENVWDDGRGRHKGGKRTKNHVKMAISVFFKNMIKNLETLGVMEKQKRGGR
jgi:hypothetical protein